MKPLLSAAMALAIIAHSAAALADSGDAPQPQWPLTPQVETVTAAPLASDVGNERETAFAGGRAQVTYDTTGLLPAAGNEAIVQTANSAPHGFADGTLAMLAAQAAHHAVSRVLAQR